MARQPRFTLPGIPQHIIQRGHNREPCFYAEEDYCRYRGDLIVAARKTGVRSEWHLLKPKCRVG